jgi:hypothetical protein
MHKASQRPESASPQQVRVLIIIIVIDRIALVVGTFFVISQYYNFISISFIHHRWNISTAYDQMFHLSQRMHAHSFTLENRAFENKPTYDSILKTLLLRSREEQQRTNNDDAPVVQRPIQPCVIECGDENENAKT